ncbi:hypothetical protein D3C80_1750030 [compost metagenome]
MQWHAIEQVQKVGIAQAHTAMGQRHAHWFAVGRAVQVNITTEGVNRPQAIQPWLATAEPEDPGEDPVASGVQRMQGRGPGLAGPTPPAQHRALRQARPDFRPHLMQATRRTA